ncbi:MAG: hypothetical protein WDN08_09465 [Rhizomicrobium sp.]
MLLLIAFGICHFYAVWRERPVEALTPASLNSSWVLGLNDAVVTGFSGTAVRTVEFAPPPKGEAAVRQTFIDTNGPAARILDMRTPRAVWNGQFWTPPQARAVTAREVGQVFGIAIDDRAHPDVYLAATSVYGLNLVAAPPRDDDDDDDKKKDEDDDDRLPQRLRSGGPTAQWMEGQFGPGGGPTSIWKIDGRSGAISLFATITLNGVAGGPAALGNLAYDSEHHQLFVSDLSTGMIHRLDLAGRDLGHFDHGVDGRRAAALDAVAFDSATPARIADPRFNPENPATWGFAPAPRRVWGLAVHGHRLYYAVADGHIWSVGLKDDGDFAGDPRKEIDLPAGAAPVSDIVFSHDGAMIAAQRTVIGTHFDYRALAPSGASHVWRFWPERPDDPNTPSSWYQQPEEYAVGFAGNNRGGSGGVDLGYGYKSDGTLDLDGCEDAIFFTGQALRDFRQTPEGFVPGGPLKLDGVQISPARPVRGFNTPPAISYFVNYSGRMDSTAHNGTLGGIRVYRLDCADLACRPRHDGDVAVTTGPPSAPPGGPPPGNPPPGNPPPGDPPPDPGCTGPDCGTPCIEPDCGTHCTGPDCTEPKICMEIKGQAVCDPASGGWVFKLTTADPLGLGLDTISAYSHASGVSVANGPQISLVPPPGVIRLNGALPGQTVAIDICAFNSADPNYQSGKPYDCCRETLHVRVPRGVCKPGEVPER